MNKKIVVISGDVIDEKMAGVAIRNWEIANSLANHFRVDLLCPIGSNIESSKVKIIKFDYKNQNIEQIVADAAAIIIYGFTLHFHPYLTRMKIPLIVDLYVPFMLESLIWHKNDDLDCWSADYEEYLRVQNELLRAGDFFFCANERQRDFWIGMLLANKRVNPHQVLNDDTLNSLIAIVPYGFRKVENNQEVNNNIFSKYSIPEKSRIVIWSGGIWEWLDPKTLIYAFEKLVKKLPDIVLFFMGTGHPNNDDVKMSISTECKELSRNLGLLDKKIFFGDWIPYNQRWQYLRSASVGVLTFRNHIETRFSNRTRLIDCLAANLFLVITEGDYLGCELAKHGLAETVPAENVDILERALERALNNNKKIINEEYKRYVSKFEWDNLINPIVEFCSNPHRAIDKEKYLTELERIVRDKDEFLQKVIADKDEFFQKAIIDKDEYLQKTITEKDEFLQKVIIDKDEFLKQVIIDKDGYWQQVLLEKDMFYQKELAKNNLLEKVKKTIKKKYETNTLFKILRKIKNIGRKMP